MIEVKEPVWLKEVADRIGELVIPQFRVNALTKLIGEQTKQLAKEPGNRVLIVNLKNTTEALDVAAAGLPRDSKTTPKEELEYQTKRILNGMRTLWKAEGQKLRWNSPVLSLELGPIELKDTNENSHYLGVFTAHVDVGAFGTTNTRKVWVSTNEAHPPTTGDRDLIHPHVRDHGRNVCWGEAVEGPDDDDNDGSEQGPLLLHLKRGMVGDLFRLVKTVMLTYNSHGPYFPLEQWDLAACGVCGGRRDRSELTRCESCRHDVCQDHRTACDMCGRTGCSTCVQTAPCQKCKSTGCSQCVSIRDNGYYYCENCWGSMTPQEKESVHDEYEIPVPLGTVLVWLEAQDQFTKWRWEGRDPLTEWWSEHGADSMRRQGYRVRGTPGHPGILEPTNDGE